MYNIKDTLNTIINGDSLSILKEIPSESIDMVITSPPYYNLRDYECDGQLGSENNYKEYINNLIIVFDEVKRILKQTGCCWINIGDVYQSDNKSGIKKQSLIGIPDRLKIAMIDRGWLCRNEIIWHKPNAMPSSAKTRFNNDYEKLYFFTKDDLYYFETQYEDAKSNNNNNNLTKVKSKSKYKDIDQESKVRQGMNRNRGSKLIEVRPKLPSQQRFVDFIRKNSSINQIVKESNISKTKVEHWFRRDMKGFAYPSIEDWNKIKYLLDDCSEEFIHIDESLTYFEYETDDINKNINKGRLKRATWSINTQSFKGGHFAPYPESLIETPIKACCPKDGIIMDIFMGSGTTGVVSKKLGRNYIGIELNSNYIDIANNRISNTLIGVDK